VQKGSKKTWIATKKKSDTSTTPAVQLLKPTISVSQNLGQLSVTLFVTETELKSNKISGAELTLFAKLLGTKRKIGEATWNADGSNVIDRVYFNFDIGQSYLGYEIQAEMNFKSSQGKGPLAVDSIVIQNLITTPSPTPSATPSLTPSPTPSATPTLTPSPTPSATPAPTASAEIGCNVTYLSVLPFASQRIAMTQLKWEKDQSGYVTAIATLRNDNSMALRLVEFTFSFFHKGSVIITTSTLEGNHHFFIQDDAKFNSADKTPGSWNPGQSRVFSIPTNQMLQCSSISVLAAGFTVRQGIGAS
jgi:hypothetical protein